MSIFGFGKKKDTPQRSGESVNVADDIDTGRLAAREWLRSLPAGAEIVWGSDNIIGGHGVNDLSVSLLCPALSQTSDYPPFWSISYQDTLDEIAASLEYWVIAAPFGATMTMRLPIGTEWGIPTSVIVEDDDGTTHDCTPLLGSFFPGLYDGDKPASSSLEQSWSDIQQPTMEETVTDEFGTPITVTVDNYGAATIIDDPAGRIISFRTWTTAAISQALNEWCTAVGCADLVFVYDDTVTDGFLLSSPRR